MAKILINIPELQKSNGGIYQYSIALIKMLVKARLNHDFYLLYNDPDDEVKKLVQDNDRIDFVNTKIPSYSKTKEYAMRLGNFVSIKLGLKKRFRKKELYKTICSDYDIDIIHTPWQSNVKVANVKSITTLHDIQELHFPQYFSSEQRAFRAVNHKSAIDSADAVIVSYNHVKQDIIEYFQKAEENVHTVLLDMQNLWFENLTNNASTSLMKYNLPEKYLLYPAATWEHKNHLGLIKAIEALDNSEISLICTGNQTIYYDSVIEKYLLANNLDKNVKFLGIVSNQELFDLYHNCRAVVVPTLYEAGSFPLMESMLLGIPVICSNVTSLPETIGEDMFTFDPNDLHVMGEKINAIWSDEGFRNKNLNHIKKQAENLKHNRAAQKIDTIYRKLLNES